MFLSQVRKTWGAYVTIFVCQLPIVANAKDLKTEKDKVSYLIGRDIGSNFKRNAIEVDYDLLLEGIKSAMTDKKPRIAEEDGQKIMQEFSQKMQEKRKAQQKKEGEVNLKLGKEFLAKNKKEKGVKVTKSGLQYKVEKEGKGKSPKETDTVEVNYKGTLIDGTEFDSSYKRNKPATFPLNGVIKGWTEGIQLMKPGAKYRFFIPSDLAYGERSMGPKIPANSTLIFDVELLAVKDAKAESAKAEIKSGKK